MVDKKSQDPAIVQLTRAFEKVARDEDLRFLLLNVLTITGESATPFDTNALKMAYLNGRHSVGTDLRSNMNAMAPKLYIKLLQDELLIKTRNEEKDLSYEDPAE